MNTMNFGDIITEDEERAILSIEMNHKIVDAYQIPYAIGTIIENMESVEEKISTERFLSMEKVTKCPPRIKQCIQHCIKEIVPDTMISSDNDDCLNIFFIFKDSWCSKRPSAVVKAIITLSLRTNTRTNDSCGDDIESYEWYCELVGGKIIPIKPLYRYELSSINMAFALGLIPNDETFYEIRARDMANLAIKLELTGILKLRKDVLDKSENEDENRMFAEDKKKKNKDFKQLRKGEYVLIKYCYCCICHKLGHIARYCHHRHGYVKDTWNIYHTTFYEHDPSDPLID